MGLYFCDISLSLFLVRMWDRLAKCRSRDESMWAEDIPKSWILLDVDISPWINQQLDDQLLNFLCQKWWICWSIPIKHTSFTGDSWVYDPRFRIFRHPEIWWFTRPKPTILWFRSNQSGQSVLSPLYIAMNCLNLLYIYIYIYIVSMYIYIY